MKRIRTFLTLAVLLVSLTGSAFASSSGTEQQSAAAFLRDTGIMVGDDAGNMMLDKGLTRAQMAVVLTRVVGNPEHVEADRAYYSRRCCFSDVPDWAKAYVGYCAANYLVAGYGNGLYGADDPVTPAAACTVMLRCLGDLGEEWSYNTACQTAVERGLSSAEALAGKEITRGNMAIMICRTMAQMGYDIEVPEGTGVEEPGEADIGALSKNADGSINIPSDGSLYVPKAGDVIRCDDGSNYTVTDVGRYDSNVFAKGPVGELPVATCDWGLFPELSLPEADVRRFSKGSGEMLFIRNLHETRRMEYTIYNALGAEPDAWQGSSPLATVELRIPVDLEAYSSSFWPWRASELEKLVHSRPNSRYYIEAWDHYLNGVFQYTRYCVVSQ